MLRQKLFRISYKNILKPLLFKADPERVHNGFIATGSFIGKYKIGRFAVNKLFNYENPRLSQEVHGVRFKNPVGLSAGFDKDGKIINIIESVGFGFSVIGSITNLPYGGNEGKRVVRLPKSRGLVVNFGLKNDGVDIICERLVKLPDSQIPIGASIARSNREEVIKTEAGIEDYSQSIQKIEERGDVNFYTINISCPNTFGGEPYTSPEKLERLLIQVDSLGVQKPIFIKMPINLEWHEFERLLQVILRHQVKGVTIGNLTKVREPHLIIDQISDNQKGGISGLPTQQLCNNLISRTYAKYGDKLTIIGVGGIFSAEDAYEKIKRGATLVQLITGMIFEGPQLIGEINRGIVKLLEEDGFNNISEAVGAYHRDEAKS